MNKLARENRSLFARIWKAITDFFERIISRISGKKNHSVKSLEQRVVEQGVNKKRAELEKRFVTALKQANTTAKAVSDAKLDKNTPKAENDAEGKNLSISDKHSFSISISEDNTPFVVVDDDILAGVEERDWIKVVKSNLLSKFPNGVPLGNNVVSIDRQSRKEITFSRYMQRLKKDAPQVFSDKLKATNNVDDILNAAEGWISEGLNHKRKDNIIDFSRGTVLLRIGNNDYSADVIVGTRKNGAMLLYDIINLTPINITKKETNAAIPVNSSRRAERKTTLISSNIIPDSVEKSNSFSEKSLEDIAYRDFSLAESSDRAALAEAFYNLATTEEERNTVKKYRKEIIKIDEQLSNRQALKRRYDELKGMRSMAGERSRLNGKIVAIDEYVSRHDKKLLELSAAKP